MFTRPFCASTSRQAFEIEKVHCKLCLGEARGETSLFDLRVMDLDGPTHLVEIPKGLGLADFDIYGTVVINIDVNITIMLV